LDNWTNEVFTLMTEKLAERKQREADAMRGKPKGDTVKVKDTELFAQMGNQVKVAKVKHGD